MVEQSRLAAVEHVGSSEYTSVAADLTSVHGEAEKYVCCSCDIEWNEFKIFEFMLLVATIFIFIVLVFVC